jgi:hypothetical protein
MSNQRLDKRKSNDDNNIDSPTPKKTRKQTKLRSFVWEFFKKIENPDETECLKCGKRVSFIGHNTKGMMPHLKTTHEITEELVKEKKKEETAALKQKENDGDCDDDDDDDELIEEIQENLSTEEINKLVQGKKIRQVFV